MFFSKVLSTSLKFTAVTNHLLLLETPTTLKNVKNISFKSLFMLGGEYLLYLR